MICWYRKTNKNPLEIAAWVKFSSVAQSCLTLCDPMNRSTPGLPVHHQLREFTQTHVRWISDAIQPSHPLLSPSSSKDKLTCWAIALWWYFSKLGLGPNNDPWIWRVSGAFKTMYESKSHVPPERAWGSWERVGEIMPSCASQDLRVSTSKKNFIHSPFLDLKSSCIFASEQQKTILFPVNTGSILYPSENNQL